MLTSIVGAIIGVAGVLAAIFALLNEELNKNRSMKFVVVGLLLSLAVYAMIGSAIALQAVDSESAKVSTFTNTSIPLAIDSTKDWQSTGVLVNRGDRVSVRVIGGKWTAGRYSLPQGDRDTLSETPNNAEIWVNRSLENTGVGGLGSCQEFYVSNCPVPSSNVGVLIGRVGISDAFAIGNAHTFTASADGILYLRINDGEKQGTVGLEDNFGILAVEVATSE